MSWLQSSQDDGRRHSHSSPTKAGTRTRPALWLTSPTASCLAVFFFVLMYYLHFGEQPQNVFWGKTEV